MQLHRHTLSALLSLILASASAQVMVCPGEPLIFQLEGEHHGTKIWEHSTDGVTWNSVEVTENEAFTLQPEQAGWYRVHFHDEDCDVSHFSEAVRFAVPAIDLGEMITLSIGGQVRTEWGTPLFGATVRAGCGSGITATTDHHGVFLLQGVQAFEGLATVTVEKEGFFPGSRSFIPAESATQTISQVHITMLPKNLAGTVDGSTGGMVALEGITITFPQNGFVQDGLPFSGTVSVFLNHIDPTSDDLHRQMPGMLMGVMGDEPQLLLSYGMIGVELNDASGNTLQLAPGSLATVRFPVMPEQQANAPDVMPLWSYDETLGYWVHEGEAALVGNEYVGQVAHFSWWNIDIPGNFVELKGVVFDVNAGGVLANAQVVIITENMGSGITYTNGMGEFTALVPIGQMLNVRIWMPCGEIAPPIQVLEEVIGPFQSTSAITLGADMPLASLFMGMVLDCDGQPVQQGYALVRGIPVFCSDGAYQFRSCAELEKIRGFDLLNHLVSPLVEVQASSDTTSVEDLTACTSMYGAVTDLDGNTYPTVVIGQLEWMAENLRSSSAADGTPIPNVTINFTWTSLNGPALCHFANDPANDLIHGKLYNWHAVTDAGGICPQGWHIPSDLEWQELEAFLGMNEAHLSGTGFRGWAENVGGRLKSIGTAEEGTGLWLQPGAGATNETGFSGTPGGYRANVTGYFMDQGSGGSWWTSTDNGSDNAWYRSLGHDQTGIYRSWGHKRRGYSVRCVKDD